MTQYAGDEQSLSPLKNRIVLAALAVSALSVIGIIVTARYQPEVGRSNRLSPTNYAVLTQVLSTFLSAGGLTLVWEWFLRRTHARSLHQYLSLKGALVSSGLQSIDDPTKSHPHIQSAIERSSVIRAIARNPGEWVSRYSWAAVQAARVREAHIELLVPDPTGSALPVVAMSLGLSTQELQQNISAAVETFKTSWSQNVGAGSRSSISISTLDMPLYDILIADDLTVMEMFAAAGHRSGLPGMLLEFGGDGDKRLWAELQLEKAPLRTGGLWAAPAGQPNHFRG